MRSVLFAALLALGASYATASEVPAVQLDMPPGTPAPPSANPCHPVWLSLDRAGAAYVNEKSVTRTQLAKAVVELTKVSNNCERIYIRSDPDMPYGELVMVISLLKEAGITRIALISEDEP